MKIKSKDVADSTVFIEAAWSVMEPLCEKQAMSPDRLDQFRIFLGCFFHQFPLAELVGRDWEDIFGTLQGLWLFAQTSNKNSRNVTVFNPSIQQHGWQSSHTVAAVLVRDMPFVVDSLRMECNRREIAVHAIKSTVLQVQRNEKYQLQNFQRVSYDDLASPDSSNEAIVYIELSLQSETSELQNLESALDDTLRDVDIVVSSYKNLGDKLKQVSELLVHAEGNSKPELDRSLKFIEWLQSNHFTFMGHRQFDLIEENGHQYLQEQLDQRLGLANKSKSEASKIAVDDGYPGVSEFYGSDKLVSFAKSAERSTVHRAAYSDHIVIKRFDENGKVCGESRFSGLYTSAVYIRSPDNFPIIGEKIRWVLDQSGLGGRSHDGKHLRQILETFPRDELFLSSNQELYETALKVVQINERYQVRLFMRRGRYGKFVSCLVYVPRDLFNSEVRTKIQALLGEAVGAIDEEFTTYFSESILARVHLVFRVDPTNVLEFDTAQLQEEIVEIVRSWEGNLSDALVENLGEGDGLRIFNRYKRAFPPAYKEDFDVRTALQDIEFSDSIVNPERIALSFYQPLGTASHEARFKMFRRENMIELSDVIPLLEKMGLRVLGEIPYRIRPFSIDSKPEKNSTPDKNRSKPTEITWLHHFNLKFDTDAKIDVGAAKHLFEDAFNAVWDGACESDDFNRLVLGARLSWREVSLLRAYSAYMKQTLFNFSQVYIANTLLQHSDITRNLVALFKAKFDPRFKEKSEKELKRIARLDEKISVALDAVKNLSEDRILRRYLEFIQATLRTNFYQVDSENQPKNYISLKFNPRAMSDLPEPRPLFEIFVYSPRVEGVHLRGGKVARGGLRWSDRQEDFRTEVLGLVKAQQVKNAVIVPEGAKGGFVAKQLSQTSSREEFMEEGINCYKTFIRGLLDVSDNLVDNQVVPPVNVIRWDEDDPYLVVAADKGTATFSDIANSISAEYEFWLGDAFASGGSQGYDHKGMGITAKGAWVSVQRHFKEVNIDVQKQDFTVIGIGDMAGDVFGNGMLLSEHICLVAAFNHLHIFIDPNPKSAPSFEERKRLFELPKSSWEDYDSTLISEGGGVFLRSAKSISISPQMQERFGIEDTKLPPTELLNALLKAPVDLIWNGGIGTYVKSSKESHVDVGDKANDVLRVNGNDLRCRVFGEGGNLGVTQLGRVEFALNGGACNTDFIDNAAGVDCSDHEVNIKILLNELVAAGDMTEKHRNQLLASMTDSVSDLVLKNNYAQTQAISMCQRQALARMGEYQRFIHTLESTGRLNRALEFLPDDETLAERKANNQGLTRPELSVLVSYAKVMLKGELKHDELTTNDYIAGVVDTAFPEHLSKKHLDKIRSHRLKPEIIATQLANEMINSMGITFCQRLMESTGASPVQIAKAYVAARDCYRLSEVRQQIEELDFEIDAGIQLDLYANVVRRVRRATRWFLRNRRGEMDPLLEVEKFSPLIEQVNKDLPSLLRGSALEEWQRELAKMQELGLSENLSSALAMPSNIYSGLAMVEVSLVNEVSATKAAEVFTVLGDSIQLHWFANQISEVKVENFWQAMAREAYMDDLEAQMRTLAISFLRLSPKDWTIDKTLEIWLKQHAELVQRWCQMVTELQAAGGSDFAMFSVALRELLDLAQASQHCSALIDSP